jgi:hypothetical protein
MQIGDTAYELYEPARVNVAGDADDADAPTYATFSQLLSVRRDAPRQPIVEFVNQDGTRGTRSSLAVWAAHDAEWVAETRHWVAGPFWAFMNSTGLIYEAGVYFPAPLFENPFYATGYPITDAFWVSVQVGGVARDVLTQCFERRCLTWNPSNPPEWQVEAGNIGQHYYAWRYTLAGRTPVVAPITTGDVRITDVVDNPPLVGADHEWVEIRSFDLVAVQMEGWRLVDQSGITYTFPSFKLLPGATVRVHVARGIDTTTDLYWGRTGAVWNNGGDIAYLYDASGTLVSTWVY